MRLNEICWKKMKNLDDLNLEKYMITDGIFQPNFSLKNILEQFAKG